MSRRGGVAIAAIALVALTGCSGSGSTSTKATSVTSTTSTAPAPTPVTTTAPGAMVFGAYAFIKPGSWQVDAGRQTKGTTTYLKASTAVAGAFPTFSVATSAAGSPANLDDLAEQGMAVLRQRGSTVTKIADRMIGGEPAKGYTAASSAPVPGGTSSQSIAQTQYFVVHGDTVYVTTTTSASAAAKDTTAVQDSILSSWSWTNG